MGRGVPGVTEGVRRVLRLMVAAACLLVPASAEASYKIVDLGTQIYPNAVNNGDLVVGTDTGNSTPAYWNAGTFGHLPLGAQATPGVSSAVDVNDSGRIVGTLYTGDIGGSGPTSLHPFYWDGVSDSPHDVGTLDPAQGNGLGYGYGLGVDAVGDVVGSSDVSVTGGADGRAYFAPKGENPAIVGAADAPATGRYSTSALAINASGTILGSQYISSSNTTSYYLWSALGGHGTPVDLSPTGVGLITHSLADDGSVVGAKLSSGYLRLPNGSETPLTGMNTPYAVNSAHKVVGEGSVSGHETALIWQNGQTTPLSTMIPAGSGWTLQRAFDINDHGDIVGVGMLGGVQHAYLLQSGIRVDDTGDGHDAAPGDGSCADSSGKCTLRAAIEEANASASASPVDISFDIPGGGVPTITPATALPPVTAPVSLDASTQPGTGRERVTVGSKAARLGFGGLDLQGNASSVKALTVAGFGGVGLKLEGAGGDRVSQSVVSSNDVGIEVDSPSAILDGLGVVSNGNAAGASAFEAAVKGKSVTPAQAQGDLLGEGGGIIVRSGAQNLTVRGSVIGGFNPADGASPGTTNQAVGVLLAPASGAISGVTIGDPTSPNFFRGNGFGVVASAPRGAVSSLTVAGNNFGVEPGGGAPLTPVSNGIGVLLSGNVPGARIGRAGAKNTFVDSGVAIQALGMGITHLRVQFNLVGPDTGLGDLISSLASGHAALGRHNMIGLVLGDVAGATVGGPLGSQNAFLGDVTGILMSGKHSRLNTIEGNTFGRFATPPGKVNARPLGDYGTLEGIVASEGGANQIGVANLGNRVTDALVGIQVAGESSDIISANSVVDNLYGLVLNDVEQTSVGNASGLNSNAFENNWIGTLQAQRELTRAEASAARLQHAPADANDRGLAFTAPVSTGPLAVAGALSSAKVDATAVTIEDQSVAPRVFSARYGRNYVGTASGGGARNGNYFGMAFAGAVSRVIVGVGGGGPNVIEHNHAAGVAMFGVGEQAPHGITLKGNAIYDNSVPADPLFPGAKGLGIDLTTETGGATVFGPTPNDPGDVDSGPNGLQNYPSLTGVARSPAGNLSYELALESTPDKEFGVELYSSPKCNPHGFGEGLHLLVARSMGTGQAGSGVASAEPTLRLGAVQPGTRIPRGDHFLSATATAPDGSTSEFSPCVKIASRPAPLGALPIDTGVSTAGDTAIEVFNAGAYDVREVQLEISGYIQPGANLRASVAQAHKRTHVLALRHVRIRPHHAGSVRLRLSAAARRLLAKDHRLTVTAVVTASKGKRHHSVKIRYVIYAPRRHKR